MWWSDGKITTISFPGFFPTRCHETRERDPSWAWHVSPRIWEITNEWIWGGTDKCEICLSVKHTVHGYFQDKFNIALQRFSLQYRLIIKDHKLLGPIQCGFRSNHSTEFASAAFSDFIRRDMDQGLLTDAVFIDLRKAFDSVDHDLLNRMDLRTVNWIVSKAIYLGFPKDQF